ncbi:hypothetical protein ABKN59_002105 [Abortiporus biennis]
MIGQSASHHSHSAHRESLIFPGAQSCGCLFDVYPILGNTRSPTDELRKSLQVWKSNLLATSDTILHQNPIQMYYRCVTHRDLSW